MTLAAACLAGAALASDPAGQSSIHRASNQPRQYSMVSSAARSIKHRLKSWLIDRMFAYPGSEYQRTRFSLDKFALIARNIDIAKVGSVLDVGCNEGYITAEFAKLGKFCVGIDAGPYFLNHVLRDINQVFGSQSAAYGVFPIQEANIASIPRFDLILLLSVHHQLTYHHGDAYTRRVVKQLIETARQYLVIEFAATAAKYRFSKPQFIDNDEATVTAYAEAWLRELAGNAAIRYLGKNREGKSDGTSEPYRFVFLVSKDSSR
jgi:SAM-dependent methyltransferase